MDRNSCIALIKSAESLLKNVLLEASDEIRADSEVVTRQKLSDRTGMSKAFACGVIGALKVKGKIEHVPGKGWVRTT